MADITFTVSTNFLTKARAAIVHEQPELAGETNAVLNEAARQRIRTMTRDWVNSAQRASALVAAQAAVVPVTDPDIT